MILFGTASNALTKQSRRKHLSINLRSYNWLAFNQLLLKGRE